MSIGAGGQHIQQRQFQLQVANPLLQGECRCCHEEQAPFHGPAVIVESHREAFNIVKSKRAKVRVEFQFPV